MKFFMINTGEKSMTLRNKLAIGLLVGALGFSSAALAAGKGASDENKTTYVTGLVVAVDAQTRHITVKDTYTGKLYKVYVPKNFEVRSLNTRESYLSFEQLYRGLLVNLEVKPSSSENVRARAR
jgi:hypothetical protein